MEDKITLLSFIPNIKIYYHLIFFNLLIILSASAPWNFLKRRVFHDWDVAVGMRHEKLSVLSPNHSSHHVLWNSQKKCPIMNCTTRGLNKNSYCPNDWFSSISSPVATTSCLSSGRAHALSPPTPTLPLHRRSPNSQFVSCRICSGSAATPASPPPIFFQEQVGCWLSLASVLFCNKQAFLPWVEPTDLSFRCIW